VLTIPKDRREKRENIVWGIITALIFLGVVLLIFVSFQRTSITKSEIKTQLENSNPISMDIDTTVIKYTLLSKAQLKQAIVQRQKQIVRRSILKRIILSRNKGNILQNYIS